MNYKKIYDALIQKRRNTPVPETEYAEHHHIIPKSEGGSDDDNNLIRLTAREHYIAHLLLVKIYNDYKMICALHMMRTMKNETTKREFKVNSRLYNSLKVKRSKMMSERQKGHPVSEKVKLAMSKTGKQNKGKIPWNKGRKCSEEERRKTSEATKRAMATPEIRERYLKGYYNRRDRRGSKNKAQ